LIVHATNLLTEIKEHNVTIEVFLTNFQSLSNLYNVKIEILNALPLFKGTLSDYEMGLFQTKTYKLPEYYDPDGGPVAISF
jgi:hypothetical protein